MADCKGKPSGRTPSPGMRAACDRYKDAPEHRPDALHPRVGATCTRGTTQNAIAIFEEIVKKYPNSETANICEDSDRQAPEVRRSPMAKILKCPRCQGEDRRHGSLRRIDSEAVKPAGTMVRRGQRRARGRFPRCARLAPASPARARERGTTKMHKKDKRGRRSAPPRRHRRSRRQTGSLPEDVQRQGARRGRPPRGRRRREAGAAAPA